MAFDYQRETRAAYCSIAVASNYHKTIAGPLSWSLLPKRIVSARERRIVMQMLSQVPHDRVLDVPTGTGKLAPIFSHLGSHVDALDISEEMLDVAKGSFEAAGHHAVRFSLCDAENVAKQFPGPYDTCVCLRLLHRVPVEVKQNILAGLASIGRFAVVSFGVRLWYEPVRSALRRVALGAPAPEYCEERMQELRQMLASSFEVLQIRSVLPGLSREVLFLLRSKHFKTA